MVEIYKKLGDHKSALSVLEKFYDKCKTNPVINLELAVLYIPLNGKQEFAKQIFNDIIAAPDTIKYLPENFLNELKSKSYTNLGFMCSSTGGLSEDVLPYYKNGVTFDTPDLINYKNILLNINYTLSNEYASFKDAYEERVKKNVVSEQFKDEIEKLKLNCFVNNKDSVINVAVFTSDFSDTHTTSGNKHAVSYFTSFIKNTERVNYTIYNTSQDFLTQIVPFPENKKYYSFRNVLNGDAKNILQNLRADNIHVILDLNGFSSGNINELFYLIPKNIFKISYLGFPNDTSFMDATIVPQEYVTKDKNNNHVHFKHFLHYSPDIVPKLGYTTGNERDCYFAVFNRVNKISKNMLLTFDKIIEKNKNIKIIFKNKITDITKNKILNHIKNKNNILFEPFSETSYQHLKEYNKVVLQLDTYPYNGTTTTCESLLMGVPVLSLYNDSRFCSSMGANIINGVSDKFSKIVKSYTEYVNYAVSFANAPVDEIKESVRKSFLTYCENSEFKKEFETFLENKFKEINL
jgi:hypothetical protein